MSTYDLKVICCSIDLRIKKKTPLFQNFNWLSSWMFYLLIFHYLVHLIFSKFTTARNMFFLQRFDKRMSFVTRLSRLIKFEASPVSQTGRKPVHNSSASALSTPGQASVDISQKLGLLHDGLTQLFDSGKEKLTNQQLFKSSWPIKNFVLSIRSATVY